MTDSCKVPSKGMFRRSTDTKTRPQVASIPKMAQTPSVDKRRTERRLSGFRVQGPGFLKDQMTLKSRGPIPLYYESLHGIRTLNPFGVLFVLQV